MKNKTYVWILVTFNFFLWTSFAAADEKPQADAPKINPLEITSNSNGGASETTS
jgi:hypothetical protein